MNHDCDINADLSGYRARRRLQQQAGQALREWVTTKAATNPSAGADESTAAARTAYELASATARKQAVRPTDSL